MIPSIFKRKLYEETEFQSKEKLEISVKSFFRTKS